MTNLSQNIFDINLIDFVVFYNLQLHGSISIYSIERVTNNNKFYSHLHMPKETNAPLKIGNWCAHFDLLFIYKHPSKTLTQ